MVTQDQKKGQIEHFLANLVAAQKCIQLYPANSPMIEDAMAKLSFGLAEMFRTTDEPVVLGVVRDQFIDGHTVVGTANDSIRRFAVSLYRAQVKVLTVFPGVTMGELHSFLTIAGRRPEEILAEGGLAVQMAALGLHHVSVEEAAELQLVDRDKKADQWDILDYLKNKRDGKRSTGAGRKSGGPVLALGTEDAGELEDFFLRVAEGSPEVVQCLRRTLDDPKRLAETLNRMGGPRQSAEAEIRADSLESMTHAFRQIADTVASLPDSVQDVCAKNVAKAIVESDEPVRKAFLEQVLPEQVGQFGAADMIVAALEDETVEDVLTDHVMFHQGTWQTLENFLEGISDDAQRSAIIKETLAANLAHSSEQRVKDVTALLQDRKPLSATQGASGKTAAARPQVNEGGQFEELARQLKPERFQAEIMSKELAEDCRANASPYATDVALLLQNRRDFGVFAESTAQLMAQSLQESFEQKRFDMMVHVLEQARNHEHLIRGLLESSLDNFLNDQRLDEMVDTLRFLDPVAPEYSSVVSILRLAGERVISRMFDRLAAEPDRPSRMFLLQCFVTLGNSATDFLGRNITHPAWFVVRNIAYIFGKIASESTVDTLTGVLHHPEPRVRSELVRALGAIGGEKVERAMLELLGDSDPAVADLAAAFLGQFDTQHVLPSLRTMLLKDRNSLYKRPYVASRIMSVFGKTGGKDDLKILSDFRPPLYRLYSRSMRAVARDCGKAISRIRERMDEGAS